MEREALAKFVACSGMIKTNRSDMAGKIVKKGSVQETSVMSIGVPDPSQLIVDPTQRHMLLYEKNKIREAKLREMQMVNEFEKLKDCTFQPQTTATPRNLSHRRPDYDKLHRPPPSKREKPIYNPSKFDREL